ncbi:MAG: hypothetical protein IJK13_01580 [Lachnospiraceae bacterium]|nr:hypothetical protein [Lachnospiraceae bacterium]
MKKRIISLVLVIAMVISICQVLPAKVKAEKRVVPLEEYDAEGICANLPAKFDLRDYGYVTPVKYQMPYGLCWCFATCASLESNALMKGYGEYDLSERHLGYFATHLVETGREVDNEGFDYTVRTDRKWYNIGGLSCGVINTVMKGFGLALEERYPYEKVKEAIPDTLADDCVLRCKRCMTVPTDEPEEIKKAIVRYGALYAVVAVKAWDGLRTWNKETSAIYVSETIYDDTTNNYNSHAVNIVGWDDNFSRNNFKTKPPGDGAWIVKNTLGEEWGDEGYCYLSYYDESVAREKYWVAFEAAPMSLYDSLHQYDGGVGQRLLAQTSSVAIHYNATEDETLTGVMIKPQGMTTARVNVYKGANSIDDIDEAKSIYTVDYLIDGYDYQTIGFERGINVDCGESVYVTVSFDKCIDYSIDEEEVFWYNLNVAGAHEGETYAKKYSEKSSWKDLATYSNTPANACIKVMAKKGHDRRLTSDTDKNLGVTSFYIKTDLSNANVLKWNGVPGAFSYDIYRKVSGESGYKVIASVPANESAYHDYDVTVGKAYSYMIIAKAGDDEGQSLEKTVVVVAQTPLVKLCGFIGKYIMLNKESKFFWGSIFALLWCII